MKWCFCEKLLVMIIKIYLITVTFVKYLHQIILLIILLNVLPLSSAHAVEVSNLYTGKILVNDKTQKTRVKAHRWAIEQVLSKVSGDKDILANPQIRREVQYRSANYIKSFAFKTDEQGRTFLVDQFYQTKIDKLIKSVGGAIWGRRRPNTLIWLVVEEGINRSIVEQEQFPQLSEILSQSSDDRGLPILLPLMDTIDKDAVYSSDIWARFDSVVYSASQRYQVDNYIMARMRYVDANKEPEYQSGWLLQFALMQQRDYLLTGEFNGEQFSVLRQMVNTVGDYFAQEYAIDSEHVGAQNLELVLQGVPNITSLIKAENYLKSLPPVTGVQLLGLSHKTAKFYLSLSGEGLDVIRALALLNEFKKVSNVEPIQKVKVLSIEEQLAQLNAQYTDDNGDTDNPVDTEDSNLAVDKSSTTPSGATPVNSPAAVSEEKAKEKAKTPVLNYKWVGR